MRLEAELLAAGVKPKDLENNRNMQSGELLANICIIASILGIIGSILSRVLVLTNVNKDVNKATKIWFGGFSYLPLLSAIFAALGILVCLVYRRKYQLDNARQIVELLISLILGIICFAFPI